MKPEDTAELIRQRELALLQTDWSDDPARIDQYLAADFEEIAHNGQMNTRSSVVNWLLHKDNAIHWSLKDFRIKWIAEHVVMTIYTVQILDNPAAHGEGSIRTSIWRQQDNQWKMVFHQASRKN